MKRILALTIMLCLLLCGCSSLLDGSYSSVKPHEETPNPEQSGSISASSYSGLLRALETIISNGKKTSIISISNYNQLVVARDMRNAVSETLTDYPLGVYAVENIDFELGSNAGRPAIAVEISYLHDHAEIKRIKFVNKMTDAQAAIAQAMAGYEPGIVLHVDRYEDLDFSQWVEDHADQNPNKIIEIPQISVNHYPETGPERVLEIKFSYQNSRDTLRAMQEQVDKAFSQAQRVAQLENEEDARFTALYNHLTTLLPEYQFTTSLTPSYSLLMHGVGDSEAFATVYAAMCRQAGLECIVVTGSRDGQAHNWNILRIGESYWHLDIPASYESGAYTLHADDAMKAHYVWDYTAYPACGEPIVPPTEEPTE